LEHEHTHNQDLSSRIFLEVVAVLSHRLEVRHYH